MKKLINNSGIAALIMLCVMIVSCDTDEASPSSTIEILSGNNQSGIQGEYLLDPVVIKVNSSLPYDQLAVGSPARGGMLVTDNFDIDANAYVLDENYEARVFFSLKCEPGNQSFPIDIRDLSCSREQQCAPIASVDAAAMVTESSSTWKKICGFPRGGKIKEFNGVAYTFSSQDLRARTSEILSSNDFRRWEVSTTFQDRINDFEILSDGTFVLITSAEILFGDNPASLEAKLTGLPSENDFKYPTQLLAEDSVIFVNYSEIDFDYLSNWFRSRDRGETWEPLTTPLADSPIIRAENGDLFGLATEFTDSIYRSSDSGNTWKTVQFNGTIEGRIKEIKVDENSNLFIVSEQTGFVSSGPTTKLYYLNTTSLELTEEPTPTELGIVSRLQIYNGIPYILDGSDLYRKGDTWEFIKGPELTFPSVSGVFFQAGFDYLYVTDQDKYILSSYFGNTYSNL